MIIVMLQGGMGNQMFQYAAGRALAIRNNTFLKIDLSFIKNGVLGGNVDYRNYGLNNFCIIEDIISEEELNHFIKRSRLFSKLKISWLNRKTGYRFPLSKMVSQKGHGYDPEFMKLSNNSYLIGYWQNVKYFAGSEEIIKQDFMFKNLPNQSNTALLSKIMNCESVAIHIRRGDFKNLPVLGTTDKEYYLRAINYLVKKLSKPVLFFFSDEMKWVKENFNTISSANFIYYSDINTSSGSEADDLRLMSNCKHNIIGNSTFGWWGAWLNSNPDKIIIAPEKLFADPAIDNQLQGMIPDNWVRL
ncbi:MAG TPA: alpha-1,2-fucosyltransferase [Bacteroidales bacterium]